eukprot:826140-Pelagomonas_calceolata.AAC.5
MAKQRPGVLPPEAVQRVQNQRNKAFSSLEVLTIQHLIQISVAVLPLASLHHLLTDAISTALAQLKHLSSCMEHASVSCNTPKGMKTAALRICVFEAWGRVRWEGACTKQGSRTHARIACAPACMSGHSKLEGAAPAWHATELCAHVYDD